jgi:ankyrin repeat protein
MGNSDSSEAQKKRDDELFIMFDNIRNLVTLGTSLSEVKLAIQKFAEAEVKTRIDDGKPKTLESEKPLSNAEIFKYFAHYNKRSFLIDICHCGFASVDDPKATVMNKVDIFREYLRDFSDVNERVEEAAWTPLMYACLLRHSNDLSKLAEFPADLVQEILAEGGNHALVEDGLKSTALHIAASCGFKKAVVELIAAGAAVDVVDKDGNTPLHAACTKGELGCIEGILASPRCSAEVREMKNLAGLTPLGEAIGNSRHDVVEFLIKNRCDWESDYDKYVELAKAKDDSRMMSILPHRTLSKDTEKK